jgi:Ca2+-binding RTX toxin-like protein
MSGTAGLQTATFIVGQNPDARAGALYPTAQVTVSEALDVDGRIFLKFSVAVVRSNDGQVADLRGLFLNLASPGLLGGLAVSGQDVTAKNFSGSAINLGGGVNINGAGPDSYHIGLAFGTSGIGRDDIRFTEFSLKHNSSDPSQPAQDLRVGLLTSQNFAARLTSVGSEGDRQGSLKLLGQLPGGAVTGLLPTLTEPTHPGTGGGNPTPPGSGDGGTPPPSGEAKVDYGDDLPGTSTEPTAHLGDGNNSFWGAEGPDQAAGGPGNDVLMGNGGDDRLAGGAGDDTIDGHDGNDTLGGGGGHDRLHGLAGNDVLLAGAGNDLLEGGNGQDLIIGGDGDDGMQGEGGDDTLIGSAGADTLEGNAGRDILLGGSGSDHLAGHDENDTLVGGADTGTARLVGGSIMGLITGDRIYGDGGADLFIYRRGDGVDLLPDFKPSEGDRLVIHGHDAFTAVARIGATTVLYLGENAAIVLADAYPASSLAGPFPGITFVPDLTPAGLTATALIATHGGGLPPDPGAWGTGNGGGSGGTTAGGVLRGTPGADRLIATGWNNRIEAEGGDDTIDGGEGNAVIDAGDGRNVIGVWGWNNTVRAGDGGSVLTGPHGNTTLTFGNGDHVVMLSGWSNTLTLGTGNSIVDAGAGNSNVEIDGGHNTVVLRGFGNRIITGSGDDAISGTEGNSVIEAGSGNNRVTAAGHANQITTGDGDDVIAAGDGSAVVRAGGGRDAVSLQGWGNHVWTGAGDDVVLLGPNDGDGHIDGEAGWDTLLLSGAAAAYRFSQDPEGFVHVWGPGARSYRLHDVEGIGFNGGSGAVAPLNNVITTAGLSEMASMSTGSTSSYVLPDFYTGPVSYLRYQLLGTANGEAVVTTSQNDFVNLLDGDDAAQSGLGDDVLDGGTGSNFLSGGSGWDTFFIDGRGGGPTWGTITDWEAGEHLSIWGWRPGVSLTLWQDQAGAAGWQGATLHMDLDGNGSWDASVTWSGVARAALPQAHEYDGLLWFS